MTAQATTLYESVGAERAARVERPVVAPSFERTVPPWVRPTVAGPWPAFLAAFDRLLAAFRSDDPAQAEAVREELSDLRARLALGGLSVPSAPRRVPVEPAIDLRRLPAPDAR